MPKIRFTVSVSWIHEFTEEEISSQAKEDQEEGEELDKVNALCTLIDEAVSSVADNLTIPDNASLDVEHEEVK